MRKSRDSARNTEGLRDVGEGQCERRGDGSKNGADRGAKVQKKPRSVGTDRGFSWG